ncbi:hypothetical protein SJ822_05255, partial [Enterococcus faecium]
TKWLKKESKICLFAADYRLLSVDEQGCNPTARSLRDRSFVFSSVGLTHRKRLGELWLLFKIH